jgi:hypothetical protein
MAGSADSRDAGRERPSCAARGRFVAQQRCQDPRGAGSFGVARPSGTHGRPAIVCENGASPARGAEGDMKRSALLEFEPMGTVSAVAYLTVCERERS